MDKHTKTDPLKDFPKQCKSHAQYNKINTYNEHLDNSPKENIKETSNKKVHNTNSRNIQCQRNQNDDINDTSNHRERKDNSDNYTGTQY